MGVGDRLQRADHRAPPSVRRVLVRWGRRPVRSRLIAAATVLSAISVLTVVLWVADGRQRDDRPDLDVLRVGVVPEQSVSAYVHASRRELDGLLAASSPAAGPAGIHALVSLSSYLAPARLAATLDGATVTQVYARAPLRDVPTPVMRLSVGRVPEDVVAGMLDAAARRDVEHREFARLARALTGHDERERRLRRAYDAAAQTAAAEAAAYRSGCACLFAAVVISPPGGLDLIAGRPDVRVVDPAPEVRRLDRVEFRPPLPEQHTGVGWPTATSTAAAPTDSGRPPAPPRNAAPPFVTSASFDSWLLHPGPSAGPAGPATAVPSALSASPGAAGSAVTAGASRGPSGR